MIRTVDPAAGRIAALGVALVLLALAAAPAVTSAGEVRVELQSRDGTPVPGVAVVLEGPAGAPARTSGRHSARMDQQDRRFVPQVLVVDTGTSVEFPNSDHVSHQVYSFSPARPFQLPLYKGAPHPPVQFPSPGLVVLGGSSFVSLPAVNPALTILALALRSADHLIGAHASKRGGAAA